MSGSSTSTGLLSWGPEAGITDSPDDGEVLVWDAAAQQWTPSSSIALSSATRIIHTPGATPSKSTVIPGQGPEPVTFGSPVPDLLGLHYKRNNDLLYGYSKIQTSYVSDASFHIHWVKNVDTDESGATVRWVITYRVYNGVNQDVSGAATGTLLLDDTYDDAGTTTRIVHRTANAPASGFVAGYYVGFSIGYDPANTTLSGRPTIISCDILTRNTINQS